jgi:His-Xaa-Ser system radical SAM maturase HxsB
MGTVPTRPESLPILRDRHFRDKDQFRPLGSGYSLLPFRFLRIDDHECLVNECGEYVFVPLGTAARVVHRQIDSESALYADLCAKQFISDGRYKADLDLLATKVRSKRRNALGPTQLHIFVVTLRCDHSCHYCQVSRRSASSHEFDMNEHTANRAVDVMLESPAQHLTVELQGGEPTLAPQRIEHIVTTARDKASASGKSLSFVVTTNLANLTPELLTLFRNEGVHVSTSLDGPAFIHNANRPRPGANSYDLVCDGIERCRAELGPASVSALMTTTQLSLRHPLEIVDEYVRRSLHTIFLRPLSPYGFATKTAARTGYSGSEYLPFFKAALDRIIEVNLNGYSLTEVYSRIVLTKILTPVGTGYVDLQSPACAGFGVLVYNYDGDVYLSDEGRMLAEMGDRTMRIGNVRNHSRRDLLRSSHFASMVEAWCNESLPGCSDCAFQLYCGADPVFNHATQGDIVGHRPSSEFCKRNMAIISHLLHLIETGSDDVRRILWNWVVPRAQPGDSEPVHT